MLAGEQLPSRELLSCLLSCTWHDTGVKPTNRIPTAHVFDGVRRVSSRKQESIEIYDASCVSVDTGDRNAVSVSLEGDDIPCRALHFQRSAPVTTRGEF